MAPEWDGRGEGGWGQVQHQFHISLNIDIQYSGAKMDWRILVHTS